MSTESPVSNRVTPSTGFTLIELLIVIFVIIILVALSLSVSEKAFTSKQAIAKAKSEMALIAQALEHYKLQHSDYPWINDNAGELYRALTGQRGAKTASDPGRGKPFIDAGKLTLKNTVSSNTVSPNAFIDPWENGYHYYYKEENSPDKWSVYGFLLISAGPDGKLGAVPPNGLIDENYFTSGAGLDDIIQGSAAY